MKRWSGLFAAFVLLTIAASLKSVPLGNGTGIQGGSKPPEGPYLWIDPDYRCVDPSGAMLRPGYRASIRLARGGRPGRVTYARTESCAPGARLIEMGEIRFSHAYSIEPDGYDEDLIHWGGEIYEGPARRASEAGEKTRFILAWCRRASGGYEPDLEAVIQSGDSSGTARVGWIFKATPGIHYELRKVAPFEASLERSREGMRLRSEGFELTIATDGRARLEAEVDGRSRSAELDCDLGRDPGRR